MFLRRVALLWGWRTCLFSFVGSFCFNFVSYFYVTFVLGFPRYFFRLLYFLSLHLQGRVISFFWSVQSPERVRHLILFCFVFCLFYCFICFFVYFVLSAIIALSTLTALQCSISVSWFCDHEASYLSRRKNRHGRTDIGCAGCRRVS